MQELHCMLGRHTELLRIWHSNNTTTSISDLECYSKVGLEDLPLFSCRQNGVFFPFTIPVEIFDLLFQEQWKIG